MMGVRRGGVWVRRVGLNENERGGIDGWICFARNDYLQYVKVKSLYPWLSCFLLLNLGSV